MSTNVYSPTSAEQILRIIADLSPLGITVASLVARLRVFFHRHDGKRIKFGGVDFTGYFARQVEKLLIETTNEVEARRLVQESEDGKTLES